MDVLNFDIRLIFAILNGKVSAAINKRLAKNFAASEIDLTPEQWIILLLLADKDGVTQQYLCNAAFKDKPSMTRLLDFLEHEHLVVRMSSRKDRRVNLIYLTKEGRAVKEKSQKIALRTLKMALNGLDIDDLRTSQEVLRKIFQNMTSE